MDVLVIGGGASGMMAALTASECRDTRVIIAERQSRMGKKLLSTGNGRCNLTNRELSLSHYHGENPSFCKYALHEFDTEHTLAYFHTLGLLTVTEPGGRVYPYSDSANSVLDVLRLRLEQRENVEILTACEILSIAKRKGRFIATTAETTIESDRVIICAGGAAGAKLGGTDMGYRLLSSLGHTRSKLYPSLVQLRTQTEQIRGLKGVRTQARVCFGSLERCGELQFTDYGVSGPVIFELSRAATGGELSIDFLPELTHDDLLLMLESRCQTMPKLKAEDLLTGILHNRLGRTLLRNCCISTELLCHQVDNLRRLAHSIKHFTLIVTGNMGLEQAQVTAGGILTKEFDPLTMQSRLCKGLYAAGEVLDIDGDCGGYNLQWAWSSGRLAGQLKE